MDIAMFDWPGAEPDFADEDIVNRSLLLARIDRQLRRFPLAFSGGSVAFHFHPRPQQPRQSLSEADLNVRPRLGRPPDRHGHTLLKHHVIGKQRRDRSMRGRAPSAASQGATGIVQMESWRDHILANQRFDGGCQPTAVPRMLPLFAVVVDVRDFQCLHR